MVKHKLNKGLLLLIVPLALMLGAFMPNSNDTNAKIKAIFLYSFSKYIEWPTSMQSGSFKIAVYGEYPSLIKELSKMAATKKHGDQSFEILNYNNHNQIYPCQIIYVDAEKTDDIKKILKRIEGTPTLLVTDRGDLLKSGASINLYYDQSKQKIELNPVNAEKHQLKVSKQLMAISRVVK